MRKTLESLPNQSSRNSKLQGRASDLSGRTLKAQPISVGIDHGQLFHPEASAPEILISIAIPTLGRTGMSRFGKRRRSTAGLNRAEKKSSRPTMPC